ncbi:hypothetical protein DICPUDRAFT_17639, partial [Dictyostelium purpureum]
IIVLVFLSLYLNSFINGQDIIPVNTTAKCEKYIGDQGTPICTGYIPNPDSVYVTLPQIEVLKQVNSTIDFLQLFGCKNKNNLKVICAISFPECIEYNVENSTVVLAFPKLTCDKYCNAALDSCPSIKMGAECLGSINDPVTPGKSGFYTPISNVIYDLSSYNGPNNYTVDCINPALISDSGSNSEIDNTCPFPLLRIPRNSTDNEEELKKGLFYIETGECVLNCPVNIYSNSVWKRLYKLTDVLSVISMVSTIILMFTYGVLNPKLTRYDKKNLFFLAGIFGISLAGTMIAANDTETTLCPDPHRFAVNTDKVCVASGFITHFSALFAMQWWAIIAFDLWYSVKHVRKQLKVKIRYYLTGTFTVAIIFSGVSLGKGQYQAGFANVFCWLYDEVYQDVCFFVPLGICLTFGSIMIGMVMREIYVIVKSSTSSGANNDSKKHLKLQIKPFLNVFLFYSCFLYLFLFARIINSRYDKYMESALPYMTCLIAGGGEDCRLDGPSSGSLGYFTYCLRIYGIYAFFVYGCSSRFFKIWRESFLLQNKIMLPILTKLDSAFSRTSNGKGTSSTNMGTSSSNS